MPECFNRASASSSLRVKILTDIISCLVCFAPFNFPPLMRPNPNRSRPWFLTPVALACILVTGTAGCERLETPIAGVTAEGPSLQHYLVGAAAASLNPEGLFDLTPASAPGHRPIISPERAAELAAAFVRTWGPSLRHIWEEETGRSIDLRALEVGPRIFFAGTPYGEFPGGYHPAFARTYGPYYLVTLYADGKPAILLSVAAYNDELTIDRKGFIDLPFFRGMEFVPMGLPADTSTFRLISPEEAVQIVGAATGGRVATVPKLVRMAMPNAPASALWKLELDRKVPVRAHAKSAAVHYVSEIYVGPDRGRRLLMAVPGNARSVRVSALAVTPEGAERVDEVHLSLREVDVLAFEAVTPAQGGAQ